MSHIDTRPRPNRDITAIDICSMAARLIVRHGAAALEIAEYFAEENRILGDNHREDAWRAVNSVVADMLAGNPPQDTAALH